MPSYSSQPVSAALRLAKAKLRWRRAADELLIGAIFDELRIVRRDGDCTGRAMRQQALVPVPAMVTVDRGAARHAQAPIF